MKMHHRLPPAATLAGALLFAVGAFPGRTAAVESAQGAPVRAALATFATPAQPPKSSVASWTIAQLKAGYAQCSEAALQERLSRSTVMACSIVYEELKQRAFGGDFERLLAWWRSQRHGATAD